MLFCCYPQTTQSTLMLKKKKEMRGVDDALDFMKEEFTRRMAACDEREARFKEKQAEMKAMVWLCVLCLLAAVCACV